MIRSIVGFFLPLYLATVCAAAIPGRPGAVVPSLLSIRRAEPAAVVSKPPARPAVSSVATPPLRSIERPSNVNIRLPQDGPRIHPAVVRVVAPGQGSVSYGSGTLVDVKGEYGLVITNFHVIDEATGNISVIFPDGFYSLATVRKVDRDWDLAALSIKRPNTAPVKVAESAPQPGEPLTIAGYGSGNYRAVAGQCTQYVAPGTRMPFEMVELAASARQGDSGGPILNSHGQLAGVLFGEGGGRTAGSYCGRVKWFLASLVDRPEPPPSAPIQPEPHKPAAQELVAAAELPVVPIRHAVAKRSNEPPVQSEDLPRMARQFSTPSIRTPAPEFLPHGPETSSLRPSLAPSTDNLAWSDLAGTSITDQAKTFLAILGCCALLMFSLKALGGE